MSVIRQEDTICFWEILQKTVHEEVLYSKQDTMHNLYNLVCKASVLLKTWWRRSYAYKRLHNTKQLTAIFILNKNTDRRQNGGKSCTPPPCRCLKVVKGHLQYRISTDSRSPLLSLYECLSQSLYVVSFKTDYHLSTKETLSGVEGSVCASEGAMWEILLSSGFPPATLVYRRFSAA